jgi:hypothetical protein
MSNLTDKTERLIKVMEVASRLAGGDDAEASRLLMQAAAAMAVQAEISLEDAQITLEEKYESSQVALSLLDEYNRKIN